MPPGDGKLILLDILTPVQVSISSSDEYEIPNASPSEPKVVSATTGPAVGAPGTSVLAKDCVAHDPVPSSSIHV